MSKAATYYYIPPTGASPSPRSKPPSEPHGKLGRQNSNTDELPPHQFEVGVDVPELVEGVLVASLGQNHPAGLIPSHCPKDGIRNISIRIRLLCPTKMREALNNSANANHMPVDLKMLASIKESPVQPTPRRHHCWQLRGVPS